MTSGFFRRQFVLSYRAPATTIQWLFSQAVNDRDHAGQISCRRQVDDCTIVAAQRNDVASLNNAHNVFHRSHASIAEAMYLDSKAKSIRERANSFHYADSS